MMRVTSIERRLVGNCTELRYSGMMEFLRGSRIKSSVIRHGTLCRGGSRVGSGVQPVALSIERTNTGLWTLNGLVVSRLENCVDLDLGFTPATNLLPIRRLNLVEGQSAEVPAAWLNVAAGTLDVLPQRYQRRSKVTYWYEAPSVHYAALLEVASTGFVLQYPRLWEVES